MSFFEKYFVRPILQREGFNIVNTTAYALLFLAFSFLSYNLLKRLKIKIDLFLALSITPFILSAAIIRVLRDANILEGYLFVTPIIWLLFFFIITSFLILSRLLQERLKIPYYKFMFISGFAVFSFLLGMIRINNPIALLYITIFLLPLMFLLFILKMSKENKAVLGIQTFDSIVTAVSINWFGYEEQHVLPRWIIEISGTAFSFIIVKFLAVYACLLILDKQEDKQFSNFIKLLIAILGLSTGARDLLRLLWYV
jgi:uncharacterized membrane protein